MPDIMCIAKGYTGGVIPMAATITSQRILDAFAGGRDRAFLYGHSYCGNPLGAAVAREVLAIYREEGIVAGVAARAALIDDFTRQLQLPIVRDARNIGMIAAFELQDSSAGYTASIGWRVYQHALERGAYLRPLGNVVYIAPALTIPLPDLERLLSIVEASIRAVA
jgi:adenosylmethionine-8-amino-7-oxononanoate aminotransferase